MASSTGLGNGTWTEGGLYTIPHDCLLEILYVHIFCSNVEVTVDMSQ